MNESKQKRHEEYLAFIREHSHATVADLVEHLKVSPITVRRDLAYLHKKNLINRVYGGVVSSDKVEDSTVESSLRLGSHVEEKKRIAARAADLVQDGQIVFLDAGSSCYYISQCLKDKRIVVVTTSLVIINSLRLLPNIRLIVSNGEYNAKLDAFVGLGEAGISFLRSMSIDMAFLGTASFNIEKGCFDDTFIEREAKNTIIDISSRTYIVFDSSKLQVSSPYKSIPIDKVKNIITSETVASDSALVEMLRQRGIEGIFA